MITGINHITLAGKNFDEHRWFICVHLCSSVFVIHRFWLWL